MEMNAYELAEQLMTALATLENSAIMLRQLQKEKDQQADRIAELEKQGKPVAWMNGNEICPEIGYEATITTKHPKDLGWIPLYTHPVKELTGGYEVLDMNEYDVTVRMTVSDWETILRKAQEK